MINLIWSIFGMPYTLSKVRIPLSDLLQKTSEDAPSSSSFRPVCFKINLFENKKGFCLKYIFLYLEKNWPRWMHSFEEKKTNQNWNDSYIWGPKLG